MTQITRDDVLHLAALSNVQLADDEISSLQVDLERILGYVDKLAQLDTTGVEPTYQVTDLENVWREDVVDDSGLTTQQLLALAPAREGDQIKVPKVL